MTQSVDVRKILLKRGTTTENDAYTGPVGELTLDTDADTIRVHDGIVSGGKTVLATQGYVTEQLANVAVGNVDLSQYATIEYVQYRANSITHVGNIFFRSQTINVDNPSIPFVLDIPTTIFNHDVIVNGTSSFNGLVVANSGVGSMPSVSTDTGTVIVNGGMGVTGNIYLGTDADGRIQVGTGGQLLPNVLGQFTSNVDSYAQVNMQNLSSTALSSSDFVATADNGDDAHNFIDMGIASSVYNFPDYQGYRPNDGYLLVNGGNLLINTDTTDKAIKFMVGGHADSNVIATIDSTGIVPGANLTYSLGSPTHWWKDLYVGTNTIYIGGIPLSIDTGGTLLVDGNPVSAVAANLGNLKIQNNILGTTDNPDTGGWGGADMLFSPDGEGNSWMLLPRNVSIADNSAATEIGNFGAGGIRLVTNGGAWNATTANVSLTNTSQAVLSMPNYIKHVPAQNVNCPPNVDTVVYTGTEQWQHTIKLLLQAEGREEGTNGAWDTQSAEMIVTKSFLNDKVAASLYGRVYTSVNPLATFTAQWNATISRIEITCRPTSTADNVVVRTFATEITTSD